MTTDESTESGGESGEVSYIAVCSIRYSSDFPVGVFETFEGALRAALNAERFDLPPADNFIVYEYTMGRRYNPTMDDVDAYSFEILNDKGGWGTLDLSSTEGLPDRIAEVVRSLRQEVEGDD